MQRAVRDRLDRGGGGSPLLRAAFRAVYLRGNEQAVRCPNGIGRFWDRVALRLRRFEADEKGTRDHPGREPRWPVQRILEIACVSDDRTYAKAKRVSCRLTLGARGSAIRQRVTAPSNNGRVT